MKITDFKELIRCMPYREQAFDIKYEIWKGSKPSKIIENIFRDKNENGIITISRNDLFQNFYDSDLEEFVIKVIMWGYPTKGRGNNTDIFLEPKNFYPFIDKFKEIESKKFISLTDIQKLLKSTKGLGFSTFSKILYFKGINIEKFSALILDRRVINALNSGRFEDYGIETFLNLRYENAVENYGNYLNFMNYLAYQMKTEPDKIEMFLFEFGMNLKELIDDNDKKEIKSEPVFLLLGEGGSLLISRQINNSGVKFIYHHNEFDPTDEGLDINVNNEYDTFEQPFQLINKRHSWYWLHLEIIHEDFKNYVAECLINKLNKESVLLGDSECHRLENSLNIKLNYRKNTHSKKLLWSYETIK